MTTSSSPIMAANRPADSWSEPSDGDTDEVYRFWKDSGRLPYFSTSASVVAWLWLNPFPEPPVI